MSRFATRHAIIVGGERKRRIARLPASAKFGFRVTLIERSANGFSRPEASIIRAEISARLAECAH
jgi:hypothetical protein